MRRIAIISLVLLAGLAQPATAQFGKLGDIAKRAKKAQETFVPWTPEQESAIGEASAAKMINIFGLYDDPQMTRYVNLVAGTVSRNTARKLDCHVGILDSEIVNAFALPGGYVFVTRGALANMKDESELAGTLAHEVAHVDGRHLEKEVRARKATGWAMEEGTSKVPGPAELKNIANNIVTNALTLAYSRDKEDEADRKGTELAAQVGYAPVGLRNFLQTLAAAAKAEENHRQLALWGSTHPPSSQRVEKLTALAAQFKEPGLTLAERFQKNVVWEKPETAATTGQQPPAAPSTSALAPSSDAAKKEAEKPATESKPSKLPWWKKKLN